MQTSKLMPLQLCCMFRSQSLLSPHLEPAHFLTFSFELPKKEGGLRLFASLHVDVCCNCDYYYGNDSNDGVDVLHGDAFGRRFLPVRWRFR